PSQWHEPLSRVTIESMALGTPVISTPTGGSPEIVKDGENGFIFETREELVDAIGRVQDDKTRNKLGEGAEETIEKEFDQEAIVNRWRDIYTRLSV
ncbi:MAG: glycosyltransferase family 4 protein, partial [Candidatus Nanohaloarchaea archaeon]|nr:glycosyltransferase family 4 protein [Candidatus Nanohaloarchaea archaeon]